MCYQTEFYLVCLDKLPIFHSFTACYISFESKVTVEKAAFLMSSNNVFNVGVLKAPDRYLFLRLLILGEALTLFKIMRFFFL